ncbi:zinc finger protein 830 isoform X2 [Hyposmocoma kahamanoa]|uniref:zinc finger protein 830 isoform X2 n=1 Tax=Hyposmocoma kahamanoa TaxID=1477025 RepID=UPI000E6D8100|nr:zinc finger protein 830 isoform X2 [Hyposmocoma kahamanoa]
MSLRMQVEKKRAQEEMRRLMAERKKKDSQPTKIDNPLAKYNAGQLMCILCSSVVRSEKAWPVHLNSKQHKENVEQAKKLKELTNNFTKVSKQKRLSPPIEAPPQKKIKSILKNASEAQSVLPQKPKNDAPSIVSYHNEEVKRAPLAPTVSGRAGKKGPSTSKEKQSDKTPVAPDQPIPEGFFDDPILDAKARNIEYKDPVEEEWDKFQKEIKEEASASAEIIAGEQEEATAERQIDEIDEQIRNWSRVLELELKKEETKKKTQEVEQMSIDEDNESGGEADIDEFLDWRAKKSYS